MLNQVPNYGQLISAANGQSSQTKQCQATEGNFDDHYLPLDALQQADTALRATCQLIIHGKRNAPCL